MREIKEILEEMKNNSVGNYVLAGLTSHLIGGDEFGKVRLFEKERHQHDAITPHSHRFDFACLVLAGSVTNRIWRPASECDGDFYASSTLTYGGIIGEHIKQAEGVGHWSFENKDYTEGDCYSMKAEQVHSIFFSKGAKVLFFEGPNKSDSSVILEPVIDGIVIPTYLKPEWMFMDEQSL